MDVNQKSAVAAQNLFYDDSTFPLMEDDDVAVDQQRAVNWRTAPGAISHYTFRSGHLLPFLDEVKITSSATASQSVKGGFSTVWRVKIQPSFQTEPGEPHSFAVKELRHSETREEDFEREVECLERVDSVGHPHLVRLLAAHKTKESFQLVFPWADENLRSFWKTSPKPSLDLDSVRWMVEQLHGLASGLSRIHDFEANSGKENGLQLYGRHGDIKPENILWFRDPGHKEDRGTLVISDWGLAEFVKKDLEPYGGIDGRGRFTTQDDNFEPNGFKLRGYSPTYRAPEFDLKLPVGRAYDIWSLGCVFLEFITWMLYGHEALDAFANIRASAVPKGQKADDAYFELFSDDPGGKPRARVKWAVSMWINELRLASGTTDVFRDFLDLTEKRLLEVDPKKRATSPTVASELEDLKTNCQSDPEYAKPKSSPRKPPCSIDTLESMIGGQSNHAHTINVNMVRLPVSHTGNNTFPVASYPTGFENGGFAPTNTFPPPLFEPPYAVPTIPHQNTGIPGVPFHQASNVQRNRASASHKRKIDSIVEQTDVDEGNGAKYRNLGGSVSCSLPRPRQRDRGPVHQRREASGVLSESPAKDRKEEEIFACPFYKRDPETYGTKSWNTFTVDIAQGRTDADAASQSSRLPTTQIQKRLPKKSSLEKWNIIYRIIFSVDPSHAIPSPYQYAEKPTGPSLDAFEGYLTDRMFDDDIDMNLLSDIAACKRMIKGFKQSSNCLTESTESTVPSLVQDTLETMTTRSSVTTSSSSTLDPPPDPPPGTSGSDAAQLYKPLDMMSFLDDTFLDDANCNSLINWVCEEQ
ncbi:hypothetical protein NM208_g6320 [Fusarium decemcellulare]|uniref:Uncharacterized protein n=1 Tax=Fusarium decemcellulare TaxID=57161 RepID=A0ACC1SDJ7_9HYPO|nr:hypothetical protein NM208_g6320 [Fusarium decemcellulare]